MELDKIKDEVAKTDSRTSKSIKNSFVALVFYFINLILQFLSRKIFLNYLGPSVSYALWRGNVRTPCFSVAL